MYNLKTEGIVVKKERPALGRTLIKKGLLRLYVTQGKSIREVADILGCSKDMVARALKRFGIRARKNVKRSGLREYSLGTLEAAARKKGLRGAARDLKVAPSTLSRFLRSRTQR